jgi:hypothetical protein
MAILPWVSPWIRYLPGKTSFQARPALIGSTERREGTTLTAMMETIICLDMMITMLFMAGAG